MNDVFIDTWAWVALADQRDDNHLIAQIANDEILERDRKWVTSNFVLAEATTLIRYKVHHAAAVGFRRMANDLAINDLLTVMRLTQAQEQAAGEIFDRYREMDLSFTDCTSFALMRELGITEAFTGDHHFEAMGYSIVP